MSATRFILIVFLSLSATNLAIGQYENVRNTDYIYVDNIKSVKFHVENIFLSQPIVELGSGARLSLTFDDLDGDAKDYTYTFIHCDRDWQPSNLSEMEYLDGFTESRIRDFRFSFRTIQNYTHYWLDLPNNDANWKVSGNYLLIVYEDEGEKIPVITRRFMVVEPLVRIAPQVVRPSVVSKMRTHQEIDFIVEHENLNIRSPQQEVRAVVLQNGRWDNAIKDLSPIFTRFNQLVYDYQDKIVFPAGKEFRYLDLRSLRLGSENILEVAEYDDGYDVTLYGDLKRDEKPYIFMEDLNGNFIIETMDQNDNRLSSNYANVLFSLKSPSPFFEDDIYIFGALTDWQLKEEFKMEYSPAINAFVAKAYLKQGFYDYAYAVVPKGKKNVAPDLTLLEGDWYETENNYTILLYYRPFSGRYDRLIGAATFTSSF